jgi:plastocyanin
MTHRRSVALVPILTKGQSHAMTFASAATYEYRCGLHPNMKGTVEVK